MTENKLTLVFERVAGVGGTHVSFEEQRHEHAPVIGDIIIPKFYYEGLDEPQALSVTLEKVY